MVTEQKVEQIPVTTYKAITEERVEPYEVKVAKVVPVTRTVRKPVTVEKWLPYTYTIERQKTVVNRIPLETVTDIAVQKSVPLATPSNVPEEAKDADEKVPVLETK
jgi:hypothetical protein